MTSSINLKINLAASFNFNYEEKKYSIPMDFNSIDLIIINLIKVITANLTEGLIMHFAKFKE